MDENEIEKMVEKYLKIIENDEKFDRMTPLLPSFIHDIVTESSGVTKQLRMSRGIFISLIVDDYYKHIQELYDINPLLYEEERLNYVRKQLPITIIPETVNQIEEIKKLIGTSDKIGVIKNSIEYYIKNSKESMLKEDILMDDD